MYVYCVDVAHALLIINGKLFERFIFQHTLHINEGEIIKAIRKLLDKAGTYLISVNIIKDHAEIFVTPLTLLFNLTLRCGIFPMRCRTAKVCLILIKGDSSDSTNYSPILILNNFSKIFELCLYSIISNTVHNQISVYQHGFIPNRSTYSTCRFRLLPLENKKFSTD